MCESCYSDEQIAIIVRELRAHCVEAASKKYKVLSHTICIWRWKCCSMEPSYVSELNRISRRMLGRRSCWPSEISKLK